MPLCDILAIVDGLVVELHHHLLRAVLQRLRLNPHGRVHALLHCPVHRAVGDQFQLRYLDSFIIGPVLGWFKSYSRKSSHVFICNI